MGVTLETDPLRGRSTSFVQDLRAKPAPRMLAMRIGSSAHA